MEETRKDAAGPEGQDNLAFEGDSFGNGGTTICSKNDVEMPGRFVEPSEDRATWGNSVEFLMSCIALSIGFGNVWRFPYVAYNNGGGAFLIPYIIVLFLVGKPFYYLEMIIGQLPSKSCVKLWSVCPGFTGVGWAQMCSLTALASYYSSLMALTLFYLVASFASELPWALCREEWNNCVDSAISLNGAEENFTSSRGGDVVADRIAEISSGSIASRETNRKTSAEFYFKDVVLKEADNIDDGIGLPDVRLTLCLFGSWLSICLILLRGIKSSGKASYFLAIFPYVIMIALLIRAVTLEGAMKGILFFITPQWDKLLDPSVWYQAVVQCFFSVSICFGSIIMYASHNNFRHNIYRDAMIVTTLDTITSIIAGCTIFGILGNLAHETKNDDISTVVRPGSGLAFISYPDAIVKFTVLPQLFSVLFFLMLFVLGIGCAVGIVNSVIRGFRDQFPHLKQWQVAIPACCTGFAVATIYVTPGGQFMLTLVDYYGAGFVAYVLAIFEIIGIIWVYGLENFLDDIEFMLNRKPGVYWRLCWVLVSPLLLVVVFVYSMATLTPLEYNDVLYPKSAYIAGWLLFSFGAMQIPLWMLAMVLKNWQLPLKEMLHKTFRPSAAWGPHLPQNRREYQRFKEEKLKLREMRTQSQLVQQLCILFNIKPK